MSAKKEFIKDLAIVLNNSGTVMSGFDLADNLNNNGYRTDRGDLYEGLRGTYTLIRATYHWYVKQGLQHIADMVAQAFVKPDGEYAYE